MGDLPPELLAAAHAASRAVDGAYRVLHPQLAVGTEPSFPDTLFVSLRTAPRGLFRGSAPLASSVFADCDDARGDADAAARVAVFLRVLRAENIFDGRTVLVQRAGCDAVLLYASLTDAEAAHCTVVLFDSPRCVNGEAGSALAERRARIFHVEGAGRALLPRTSLPLSPEMAGWRRVGTPILVQGGGGRGGRGGVVRCAPLQRPGDDGDEAAILAIAAPLIALVAVVGVATAGHRATRFALLALSLLSAAVAFLVLRDADVGDLLAEIDARDPELAARLARGDAQHPLCAARERISPLLVGGAALLAALLAALVVSGSSVSPLLLLPLLLAAALAFLPHDSWRGYWNE